MDRRFDLRHVAAIEKEQSIGRAIKGTLMLVLGILFLAVAWWIFPMPNVPTGILYALTTALLVGCAAWIWLILDAFKGIKMAKKYLHEWEV